MKTTGLKVISVIMAVLLWFYVVNQGDLNPRQNIVTADLRYTNLGEGLSIITPETVSVKLWGLFQEPEEILAYVDVNGLEKGTYQLPVQVEPVKGAMFTSVEPDKVEVVIKGEREKHFSISHVITRNPVPGYEMIDILKSPEECLAKGEESIVNQVKTVICEIDLGNITGIGTITAPLKAIDATGKIITAGLRLVPDKINVYVVVNENTVTKQIPVKPLVTGILPEDHQLLEVRMVPETVTIILPATAADTINELITEKIELNDKLESFSQEIQLSIPEGVKAYPDKVIAEVIISKSAKEADKEREKED